MINSWQQRESNGFRGTQGAKIVFGLFGLDLRLRWESSAFSSNNFHSWHQSYGSKWARFRLMVICPSFLLTSFLNQHIRRFLRSTKQKVNTRSRWTRSSHKRPLVVQAKNKHENENAANQTKRVSCVDMNEQGKAETGTFWLRKLPVGIVWNSLDHNQIWNGSARDATSGRSTITALDHGSRMHLNESITEQVVKEANSSE
jgi:hypothetical protein